MEFWNVSFEGCIFWICFSTEFRKETKVRWRNAKRISIKPRQNIKYSHAVLCDYSSLVPLFRIELQIAQLQWQWLAPEAALHGIPTADGSNTLSRRQWVMCCVEQCGTDCTLPNERIVPPQLQNRHPAAATIEQPARQRFPPYCPPPAPPQFRVVL